MSNYALHTSADLSGDFNTCAGTLREPHRAPLNAAWTPYDLFGEFPVTWPEVWEWIETTAHIPRDSWRAPYYIRWWNVPEKIRAAKMTGNYEKIR